MRDAGCAGKVRVGVAAAAVIVAVLGAGGCGSPGSPGSGGAVAPAGSVPFPAAVGNTWTYKVTGSRASKTVSSGTQTDTVTAVVPDAGGQKVTIMMNNVTQGSPVREGVFYLFRPDGVITSSAFFTPPPAGQPGKDLPAASYLKFPSAAALGSGRPAEQTVRRTVKTGAGPRQETDRITIQGMGTETVTVPAGTYRAILVSETETVSVAGGRNTMTTRTKTWLAPGVGPVQEQITLNIGSVSGMTTVRLVSFRRG